MANPAFTHSQRETLFQDLIERLWNAPAQAPFIGGWQPYAPRKLNPLLLSVDNPIVSHFARRPIYQAIIRAWEPPPPNAFFGGLQPLASRKLPPSLLSVDSPPAYAWELLTLPAEDQTVYFRQHFQKIAATFSPVVTSTADWSSAGSSTVSFIGLTITADQPPGYTWKLFSYDDDSLYYQTQLKKIAATSVQPTSQSADWISTGTSTAIFNGAGTDAANWLASGTSLAQFNGNSIIAGDWVATGIGTAQFTGAASDTAAWSSLGAATVSWNEASVSSGNWTATGIGTASFVSNAAIIAAADWKAFGTSSARFTAPAPRVANRDGMRLRTKRLRKDEDEIMAIVKTVLPLLHRGIRQPTRISL